MASGITYNGKFLQTPGVYTSVDTSALSAPGLGASGIVALIGSATGGIPYAALTGRSDIRAYTSPTALSQAFPGGDLLEAANFCFAASQDPAINGGAQFVIPLKANPSTQASVGLAGSGGPSITVSAQAYGLSGNTITAQVAQGTTSGVKLTITQGQTVEIGDNLGDEPVGTLSFTPQAAGWQQMTGSVVAGTVAAQGTFVAQGKASDLTASTLSATAAISVTAASGDAGKSLTLYGLDTNGAAQTEVLTLSSGAQSTSKTYSRLLGAVLNTAAVDVKLVDNQGVALAEIGANQTEVGVQTVSLPVSGLPSLKGSSAGEKVILAGTDALGNALVVGATLATLAQSTTGLSAISAIVLGGVQGSHTVTLTAPVVSVAPGASTTVAMASGAFQAVPGFSFTVDAEDATALLSLLDPASATDLINGKLTLASDVQSLVDWAAANSRLVSIAPASGSVGLPAPTGAPVSLAGGVEKPATPADYQACLNLLRQVRVNTVVCLTSDPAVATAVDAHCTLMCGAGQSERDAVVGIMNTAQTDVPTFAQFTSRASAINSRHTRAIGQAFTAYDSQNVLREFQPHVFAAIVAGMQAGAGVGTPLTHKTANVIGIRQDRSWSPMDDTEALLSAGCFVFEQKDSVGVRNVRNITTYLATTNIAYQEASVNQAVDFAVYSFRMAMEAYVGQRGFSGTVNAATAGANSILQQLIAQAIIAAYQPPIITIVGDVMNVAVTLAPVTPVNFIVANIALSIAPAFTNAA